VELFIDLVSRHEQNFYNFVHKVQTKGEGLFDGLMRWVELFLTFIREGIGQDYGKISLEYVLPHTGEARARILQEVDAIALYHYKLKVAYEAKVRRRFMRQSGAAADEEMVTQQLVDNVLGDLQFGALIQGDTQDIYAQDESEESDDASSEDALATDDEAGSEFTSSTSISQPKHHHLPPLKAHLAMASPVFPSSLDSETPSKGPSPSVAFTTPPIASSSKSPNFISRASVDKPLPPPPPTGSSGLVAHRRTDSNGTSDHSARSHPPSDILARKRRKRRKDQELAIEYPELTALPELLPLFVEMVGMDVCSTKAFGKLTEYVLQVRSHLNSRLISTST
jgi:hypothetical protein